MVRLVPGYVDPPETGPGFRKDQQRPVDPDSLWLDRRPEGFSVPPMENPQESVPHNNWIFPQEDNPARDYSTGIQGVAMQGSQPDRYAPGINPFAGPPAPFRGLPVGPPAAPLYGPQMAPDTSEARHDVRVMNHPWREMPEINRHKAR